jgi:hypothetical protein
MYKKDAYHTAGYESKGNINCQITITSWSCALLEKKPVMQLLKYFPVFYENQRFITVFTRALHWSLS